MFVLVGYYGRFIALAYIDKDSTTIAIITFISPCLHPLIANDEREKEWKNM